jgi:hypothetical protein
VKRRVLLSFSLLAATLARLFAAEAAPPAEAFFRPDTFVMPQLSPDGRRLTAMMLHDGRRHALALVDLQTKNVEVLVKDKVASVVFSSWQTDDLIFFMTEANGRTWMQSLDLRTRKINGLDRLNREGRAQVWLGDGTRDIGEPDLTKHQGGGAAWPGEDERFVVSPWFDGGIRRVNVLTGQSHEVERNVPGIRRWVFDAKGNLYAGIGHHDGRWPFVWRTAPDERWQERHEEGAHDPTINPLAVVPDRRALIVIERRAENPTARAAWFDLATGRTTELFAHPDLDVDGIIFWPQPVGPVAIYYGVDRRHYHFIHDEAAVVHRRLAEALPDHDLRPIGGSRDLQRLIVRAENSRDSGSFFLVDRASGKSRRWAWRVPR